MNLIKLDVAAKRMTISRRTVDRLIANGTLHRYKLSPGRFAIDEAEIQQYLESCKQWVRDLTPSPKVILSEFGDAELRLRNRLNVKPMQMHLKQRHSEKS